MFSFCWNCFRVLIQLYSHFTVVCGTVFFVCNILSSITGIWVYIICFCRNYELNPSMSNNLISQVIIYSFQQVISFKLFVVLRNNSNKITFCTAIETSEKCFWCRSRLLVSRFSVTNTWMWRRNVQISSDVLHYKVSSGVGQFDSFPVLIYALKFYRKLLYWSSGA